MKKRKTSINRSRVFEIALERRRELKDERNANFAWDNFDFLMLFSC